MKESFSSNEKFILDQSLNYLRDNFVDMEPFFYGITTNYLKAILYYLIKNKQSDKKQHFDLLFIENEIANTDNPYFKEFLNLPSNLKKQVRYAIEKIESDLNLVIN